MITPLRVTKLHTPRAGDDVQVGNSKALYRVDEIVDRGGLVANLHALGAAPDPRFWVPLSELFVVNKGGRR